MSKKKGSDKKIRQILALVLLISIGINLLSWSASPADNSLLNHLGMNLITCAGIAIIMSLLDLVN